MVKPMFQIARYLRPKKFRDVLGQSNSVNIIHSALCKNRMLPVCILYGASGVGKTTIARLIAMWLCCRNKEEDEPCGSCPQCVNIINDSHPDVFELDGGAYTGVDDVKNMLSNLEYAPSMSQKKIYILDEVHMLSKHAITCLLKRFEEPMESVQFVLATTNIDKIPDAMLSRSFRIMLSSIDTGIIYDRLEEICNENQISFAKDALMILAKCSHGSMRQALSYLEQITIICDEINKDDVRNMLGRASDEVIEQILLYASSGNKSKIGALLFNIKHLNPMGIISQILEHISNRIDDSDFLINLGYDIAESALIMHKAPFGMDLLNIIISRAIMKNVDSKPIKQEKGSLLLEEAKNIFDLAN